MFQNPIIAFLTLTLLWSNLNAQNPFVSSTAPALTGLNAGKVMQVDFDNAGNVYVQGGDNQNGQIAKFGPSGNLLWTFSSSIPAISWRYGDNFGGWTVEKTTGNVYVGQGSTGYGCSIIRLNSMTGAYDNYHTPHFTDGIGQKGEIWKMRWYCNGGSPQMLIAGGSGGVGSFKDNIGVMPLPFTGFISYNVTGITTYPYNQDVSDFVVDPANNDLYCILASGNTPYVNNRIYKNTFPYTAANQQWNSLSGYPVLREDNNTPFMIIGTNQNNPGGSTNATNILAVSSGYLFYYDGKNLKAFDKATGATVGTPVTFASTALMQQGIFADGCNNVYIGADNGTIKVFRFNGTGFDDNAVADISIPGYSGKAVYALAYNQDLNLLYAGGDGFVGSFSLSGYCVPPPPPPPVTYNIIVNPTATAVTASINPVLPAGAVVTYTLLSGTTVIGSNSTGSFTNLDPAADYTMKADIILGCTSAQAIIKFKLKSLALEVEGTDVCGTNGGVATAVASGGYPPYTYSIDGINFQQSNVFPNLMPGPYTVMVKDASGNTISRPVTIVISDLIVDAGNDAIICEGTAIQLSGSANVTSVSWSPSAGLSSTAIVNPKAFPPATTKYYFSATKNLCTFTDSLVIQVLPAPIANAGLDTSVCYASDGVLRGSGGDKYAWKPSTYLNNADIAEPVVSHATRSVVYTLQVTDGSGCRSIHDDTVVFRVIPQAKVLAGRDTIIASNQPLQLQAVDLNGSGFNQYTWFPAYGLNNTLLKDPVAVVDNNITYEVTASTPEGCTSTDAVKVTVFKNSDVYVPNAFTPNGDSHNDVFRITAPGIKKLVYFTIFNRWGQEVFRTTNPLMGWNGSLNGTAQDAGTYVWMVEAVDYTGKVIKRKGTILLLR
jgi:gliding motility-associated-like protein